LQHASYIASWLEVLQRDKRAVFVAAAQAQKAADYLLEQAGGIATRLPRQRTITANAEVVFFAILRLKWSELQDVSSSFFGSCPTQSR
jgi:hypothetical protein